MHSSQEQKDLELCLKALSLRRGTQSALLQLTALVMILAQYWSRRLKHGFSTPLRA